MGRIIYNTATATLTMFIFICAMNLRAQNGNNQHPFNNFPKEEVKLISNTNLILSGQSLDYQTTCFTKNSTGSLSDIVYVELISDSKTVIFKHKLRLDDGNAYGDYFIPTTVKTGNYKLIAYTQWSLNNLTEAYDQVDITVINPYFTAAENNLKSDFDNSDDYLEVLKIANLVYDKKAEDNGLKVTVDSKIYKPRSKVDVRLQNMLNTSNNGNYAISVKRIDSIEVKATPSTAQKVSNNFKPTLHLPEMRGELIKGTVVNLKTNEPVLNEAVSLSIAGQQRVFKSTKTNSKGEFYFNLFESYDYDKAKIQVVADDRNDYKIKMEPKVFDRYEELEFSQIKLNPNLQSYITKNSVYNQVESAYYNVKKDSLLSVAKNELFYGEPDVKYVLDDFKRFPSVQETFVEVVKEAAVRKKGESYRFFLYDYDNPYKFLYEDVSPLLMMDGVQIQDEKLVVEYNPALIESVNLVKGLYSLGSELYNGIIDIKLKRPTDIVITGNFVEELDIEKPVAEKNYYLQKYDIDQNKRIPDLRTQLLWKPNIELESNSENIEFYTSDVSGFYMIEVKGFTSTGKSIHLKDVFEVADN